MGPKKPAWQPLPVMGGVVRPGPGSVLAGRRLATRRKWHAHRQLTLTRVAKRSNLVLLNMA